jgi:hypothetical protein
MRSWNTPEVITFAGWFAFPSWRTSTFLVLCALRQTENKSVKVEEHPTRRQIVVNAATVVSPTSRIGVYRAGNTPPAMRQTVTNPEERKKVRIRQLLWEGKRVF